MHFAQVLVELKKLLEYHKHPFLGLLFLTLRALLQEHATKVRFLDPLMVRLATFGGQNR